MVMPMLMRMRTAAWIIAVILVVGARSLDLDGGMIDMEAFGKCLFHPREDCVGRVAG